LTDIPRQLDVLIAGAGPAGSTTAALLAGAGFSVLAIDRARFPRDKPCAEYMSPEAVRILNRLGVVERLEEAGAVALEGMRVTACRGATAHGLFARARHRPFRPTGLSVSRWTLDHLLVEAARAAGAQILEHAALEEVLYADGGIGGAVIRDGAGRRHSIHARLTVGADGLRSIVARRMGRRTHSTPRRIAFVTHVDGVQQMSSSAELHFGRTGYVGLNQIAAGRTNVAVLVPAARATLARSRVHDFFFEALGEFAGVRERVESGTIVKPIMVTGPFAARSRPVTVRGGLLVSAEYFRTYRRLRRQAFAAKWMMERITRGLMHFPRLFDRTVERLGRSDDMAHTAVGVAGGFVPLRAMLSPGFIARVVF
jgi:2-polyprenyl-6-methoxyphenol hydroxylase-like FAD-dependent oxidoreductase